MEGGRALRAGVLVALSVGACAFAAFTACSPLELDLTEGDAGPADSSAPDATVPGDSTITDAYSDTDGAAVVDAPSPDADTAAPLPCSTTADCPDSGATPRCNVDAGVCVQCLSASDCTKANALNCIGNVCVACSTNADCNDGGTEGGMVCNTFIPRCASPCSFGTMCNQSGQTGQLVCNQSAGYCVECTDDTYCAGVATGTHCYLAAGVCGCQGASQCPSAQMPNCGPASPTGNRFCQK
jgi:hypothetical protein